MVKFGHHWSHDIARGAVLWLFTIKQGRNKQMADKHKIPIGSLSRLLDTWALGLFVASITAFMCLLLMAYLNARFGPSVLFAVCVMLMVLWAGAHDVPADSNAVRLRFKQALKESAPDGLIWWFPSWFFGCGLRVATSVAKDNIPITIGDTTSAAPDLYAKGRTPVSFEIVIIGHVFDVYTWDVIYKGKPVDIVVDSLEGIVRWFAGIFYAEELIHMTIPMSKALVGEVKGIVIDGIEVLLEDHGFDLDEVVNRLAATGFEVERILVKKVNVPRAVADEWMRLTIEYIQEETETKDAWTTVEVISILMSVGLTEEQASNLAALIKHLGQKHVFSLEAGDLSENIMEALAAFMRATR